MGSKNENNKALKLLTLQISACKNKVSENCRMVFVQTYVTELQHGLGWKRP